eukprot:163672-Lingulodinium_polyedra.AAC.1
MGGRYLGAWLSAAARGALQEGERWERAAFDFLSEGTWRQPAETRGQRSQQLTFHPFATAVRAE